MIIGSKVFFFENLTSTNTYLSDMMLNNDLPEGTIVRTNYQTAGRGQKGNKWDSQDGMNLLISILLYPTMINPVDQFLISMALSLGICDFLKTYTHDYSIKWPNDIYISNDKIAGILIENSIMGDKITSTIAGIGLNINQRTFQSSVPNPVSLNMITGRDFDLLVCFNKLISELDKRYKQLLSENYSQTKEDYISKLYLKDKWHSYRDKNGVFRGCIRSVSDHGNLQIENSKGRIVDYGFKDISFMS